MLESLPLAIRTELEIMRRQEFPEDLKFLPSLFDLLMRNRASERFMCELEAKIQEKQAQEENEKQKARSSNTFSVKFEIHSPKI